MNLINFAIASIVDANTGYRQLASGGSIDTGYAGPRLRETRSHAVSTLVSRLRNGFAGLLERSRAKAEQRQQLAELLALSDRSLRDIGLHRGDIHAVASGQISFADLRATRRQGAGRDLRSAATGCLQLPRSAANDSGLGKASCA